MGGGGGAAEHLGTFNYATRILLSQMCADLDAVGPAAVAQQHQAHGWPFFCSLAFALRVEKFHSPNVKNNNNNKNANMTLTDNQAPWGWNDSH